MHRWLRYALKAHVQSWALLVALAVPLHAQTSYAQTSPEFSLSDVMAMLAQTRSATAEFTETRTSPLLTQPLRSTGTLIYTAPDYIRKTTQTPVLQDFVLQNGDVVLRMEGQTRHFTVDQAPELAGLIEGVRATLAGDLSALQRYYTVSLSGHAQHWQLLLRPREAGLGKMIAWMSITGTGNQITEIDRGAVGGEKVSMQVHETLQNTADHAP